MVPKRKSSRPKHFVNDEMMTKNILRITDDHEESYDSLAKYHFPTAHPGSSFPDVREVRTKLE